MTVQESFVAGAPLHYGPRHVEGALVDVEGESYYCVSNYDAMEPFLMSLVSDSDLWMFPSSNGALTAGRRDPDHALFPYYTDDRTHDSADITGCKTILFVSRDDKTSLWEPFSPRYDGLYRVTRKLYKSIYGNKIMFEETNHDLSLVFSYAWLASERFGWVRRVRLDNTSAEPVSIELLDGLQNLLPHGVTRRFQLEFSTLVDGYKECELLVESGIGLIKLSSIPTDRAEPSEALRATVVWLEGLEAAATLLSSVQVEQFRRGLSVRQETLVRGRRGAYFVNARLALPAGVHHVWHVVADVDRDAADVTVLAKFIMTCPDIPATIGEDVRQGTANLVRIVAAADGLQASADALGTARHFSNTLFNVMRGGIPDDGYRINRADLGTFVARASREVAQRHAGFLRALPRALAHQDLLARARDQGDPDLERLTHEYLPLTFSRRHGDPSRPWNSFLIAVRDARGEKKLNFQGNWRDIFQNWEALALSFPSYLESMIFKFADASTADGYNPYRVTRDGFDWELLDPRDPWSNIGYWSDHQVIYLLRLLESLMNHSPDALPRLLARPVFTYAHVPYRIKPYEEILADPRNTIVFDAELDKAIRERVAAEGADAAVLRDRHGAIHRVSLTEKLIVLSLAKLFNYIPEAGIWMNTQRPEWNDANNALVGNGVSMVTLYYLGRFMGFCRDLFDSLGSTAVDLSIEVSRALADVTSALERHLPLLSGPISDLDRKVVADDLGRAGSAYRASIYGKGFSGRRCSLMIQELRSFCDVAQQHIAHAIRANRRGDGLYHSYNVLQFAGETIAVTRLCEMLEGQVAVLSSGVLSAQEASRLLDTLRAGPLYRPDQDSYMLYPDRRLPLFFQKNNLPAAGVRRSRLLTELLRRGDRSIIVRDIAGRTHFSAAFRNADLLRSALNALRGTDLESLAQEEHLQILALYEEVFHHRSFTGRSGTFYKYEGLGSIYWHMVSKLLLAVHEVLQRAVDAGEDDLVVRCLKKQYTRIREGIGVHKSPEQHGAIPTDPYSHTPGFAGAQQPGMTGQVKEDIIARAGELGLVVSAGCLRFRQELVSSGEFLKSPRTFEFYDLDGTLRSIDLGPGSLAYTLCQVPVVAHAAGPRQIEVTGFEDARMTVDGLSLDAHVSGKIFNRTGEIRRLDVFFGLVPSV